MPHAGEKIFRYGFNWEWIAPDGVFRGRWKTTDHTGVEILPPSEGIEEWMVTTPKGRREVVVKLPENTEDAAFHYAAATRRARAAN